MNIINIAYPKYPNPVKTVCFEANIDLTRARLDLEKCDIVAHIDLHEKGVIDLTASVCGLDYSNYLTLGQLQDLESEALYYAGVEQ